MSEAKVIGEGDARGDANVHVDPSPLVAAVLKSYKRSKSLIELGLDGYAHAFAASVMFAKSPFVATKAMLGRASFGDLNYSKVFDIARNNIEGIFTHSTKYSGHEQAHKMREASDAILRDLLNTGKFTREELENPPMRERCNDKLWVLDDKKSDVTRVTSDDFVPLFDPRKPSEWPNIILTSNHARAGCTDDLVELLKGVEQNAAGRGGKPLNVYRLTHAEEKPKVKDKTIVVLACHTERDNFLNGAELLERRLALEADVEGNADPAKRTLAHMSPAAARLAKLVLKCMVEPATLPNGKPLIDLDRATKKHIDDGDVYIADAHKKEVVLRADSTSIAQHFKGEGFSKGANTVTDMARFMYLEFKRLGSRLKIRDKDGHAHVATDQDIKTLISNIGLLNVSPGEVPLTQAEKHVVGMKRVTILNTHDMTAGHLVNPRAADYDVWSDKLVTIKGTMTDLGHSIKDALGGDGKIGFIMDSKNSHLPNYQTAQDEVTAFCASNHKKHAITTLCLSPEGKDNVLYIQFAPGVSAAKKGEIEAHVAEAFIAQGFKGAKVESDLENRRRLRVVLDHDAIRHPIITNDDKTYQLVAASHSKIEACKRAFSALKRSGRASLFITEESVSYFDKLLDMPDKIIGDVVHQGVALARKDNVRGLPA